MSHIGSRYGVTMTTHKHTNTDVLAKKASRVRIFSSAVQMKTRDRRQFLQSFAACGATVPAVFILSNIGVSGKQITIDKTAEAQNEQTSKVRIVRDFADTGLELIRLLREAAEIEHSLLIQYLYAAFSIKPEYSGLIGQGDPNASDLLGVAVQEMQHLAIVNELLVELGAMPVLSRQDFPYEPDIYPFPLNLEPLSKHSLAKYAYTEAPAAALDVSIGTPDPLDGPGKRHFVDQIVRALGIDPRPNHVGSLYARVIAVFKEYASQFNELSEPQKWVDKLEAVKEQGEDDHFQFFKSVFLGTHPAFNGNLEVWDLPANSPHYPARRLPTNPSAYVGHERQIVDPAALSLAWLGNLQYWMVLMLLDHGYRKKSVEHRTAARALMAGPFLSLARHLPSLGSGMPFDQLSMGYCAGTDDRFNMRFIDSLSREIATLEQKLESCLPSDYLPGQAQEALNMLAPKSNPLRSARL